MISISQTQFHNAAITTPAQQFFVELWCELFNLDTIDSYRVRVMNANSILAELDHSISDRVNDDISINNILFICREVERILSNDRICEKHYSPQTHYTIHLLKEIHKSKKDDDLLSLRFKIKSLSALLKSYYLKLLVEEIKESIHSNDINLVHQYTKALSTELINKGYSFEFLYFLKDLFLKEGNSQSFEARWELFVSHILSDKKNFRVYFKFLSNKNIIKFESLLGIKLSSTFFQTPSDNIDNKFFEQPGKYFGLIEDIKSYDTTSAVSLAIKKIDMLRNLSRYEFRKNEFTIYPFFLVEDTTNNSFEIRSSYLRPVGFIQHGNKNRFEQYLNSLNLSLSSTQLDDYSIERITNSFKYFRMSIDAEESEIRFILSWIALEFLLKTGSHASIINRILYFLPKVISTQFFKKIIFDFSANIDRMNIPTEITSKYLTRNETNQYELNSIYELLLDDKKISSFKAEIQSELLKLRLDELHSIFSKSEILSQRFHHHTEDIEWNIQRIYRIRNKLVHSAETQINIRQLESNLTYYFTTLFNNIIYSASHSDQPTTIENILNIYDAKADYLYSQIKAGHSSFDLLFS